MRSPRLTELAREAVREVLRPGERAIDATVGNGHDTLLLARLVGPDGRVIGFDVQRLAIDQTRARLRAAGLEARVTLLHVGHEQMAARVPPDWYGRVGVVMFNLGYLPGGDKTLITGPATTVAALDQAASLLRIGGLLSVLIYRGHQGAGGEVAAVADWLGNLSGAFRVTRHDSPGPLLVLVSRTA